MPALHRLSACFHRVSAVVLVMASLAAIEVVVLHAQEPSRADQLEQQVAPEVAANDRVATADACRPP